MTLRNEQEASELWCPMVRIARRESTEHDGENMAVVGGCNTAAGTHGPRVPHSCRCIASKCAMWRWAPSTTTHTERQIREQKFALVGGGSEVRFEEVDIQVPDAPTLGYCGLAGPAVYS